MLLKFYYFIRYIIRYIIFYAIVYKSQIPFRNMVLNRYSLYVILRVTVTSISRKRCLLSSTAFASFTPNFIKSFFFIFFFVGGWDGTTHLKSGEVYDPETNGWSFISSANTARWDAGVAVDGEKIYVVGGCDRNAICTLQTECYNIELDQWDQVTSLPVATHGLKCCTIQLPSKFV